jgi:predicted acylesterase/phospholipase RssA
MEPPPSVIFQAGKLGHIPQILQELEWAEALLASGMAFGRVYGVSGGALPALGFALALSARLSPAQWGSAHDALPAFTAFLRGARSRHLRRPNLNPLCGPFNLHPLRRWLERTLESFGAGAGTRLSDIGIPLYLAALDRDATFTLFGPLDEGMQFLYPWVRVGPPADAPVVDAAVAALSTMLSTEPAAVNGEWYRDCRPAIADAGAIVADLEAGSPRRILRRRPHTPPRDWKINWITSSFVMHANHERNQPLLAAAYLDLLDRHRALERDYAALRERLGRGAPDGPPAPNVRDVDLPYVGSTEAFTNMRDSVANKDALTARFRELLEGQLDGFPFDEPANVIYGAGGFSGILAGLVTTRRVEAGFRLGGGTVRQVYGVSAGVLNGFFHAVQIAAEAHPDLYAPAAGSALADLERFFESVTPSRIARLNLNPIEIWKGWANLGPLQDYLLGRLAAYTGSKHPAAITFDDIALPLTVAAARRDGFTDFLGMTTPERRMRFAGREQRVIGAPVVRAIVAGWSMNTYVVPAVLGDQAYADGGGSFYDPALFVACLDGELTNLLNIHLDEPEGHSYGLPPRPNLLRIIFDTHNYTFPEERRRMRRLTHLLFDHYRLRAAYTSLLAVAPVDAGPPLPPDFRRAWKAENWVV